MIQIFLSGEVVPKARARVTSKGTFMPRAYREWKDSTIATLIAYKAEQGITESLEGVDITIALKGKHNRRGDIDNIAGALMDALVQSGILRNDNLKCVSGLSVKLIYSSASPSTEIRLLPA